MEYVIFIVGYSVVFALASWGMLKLTEGESK